MKTLTLEQLAHYVNETIRLNPDSKTLPVVIRTNEPSVGPASFVEVISANSGFDWDKGKFFIFAKEDIVRKK